MSIANIERTNQLNEELINLCGEIHSIATRAATIAKELEELNVPLKPEVRAMFIHFAASLRGVKA